MSGYEDLRLLGVTFRPIDGWPGEITLSWKRERSPFSAEFSTTVGEFARELRALKARLVVVQLALGESDFRIDGMPKANARAAHPGVVVAFDSKWGPLKYATDKFVTWQENLRAVALSMEALRKVDRYGVSKRGEQYRGWRALPTSTDAADAITTREQALAALAPWDGDVRRALMETHPDRGGDPDAFRRVIRARDILGGQT